MPYRIATPVPLATAALVAAAMGTVISVKGGRLMDRLDAIAKDREPVTNWIVVHELSIPDFKIGADPNVVLSRTIFRDLTGQWSAKVHDAAGHQVCPSAVGSGAGQAHYTKSETGVVRIPFKLYTGGCELKQAGKYRATVLIRLADGSATPDKSMSFQSNWFYVTD